MSRSRDDYLEQAATFIDAANKQAKQLLARLATDSPDQIPTPATDLFVQLAKVNIMLARHLPDEIEGDRWHG